MVKYVHGTSWGYSPAILSLSIPEDTADTAAPIPLATDTQTKSFEGVCSQIVSSPFGFSKAGPPVVSIPSAMDSKESESESEKENQLPVHQFCAMI